MGEATGQWHIAFFCFDVLTHYASWPAYMIYNTNANARIKILRERERELYSPQHK